MAQAQSESSNTSEKLSRFFFRLITEGLSIGADKICFVKDDQLDLVLLNQGRELKRSTIKSNWFDMVLAWLIDHTIPSTEQAKRISNKTHVVISGGGSDDISFVCYLPCGNDDIKCDVVYYHQDVDGRIIELFGFKKHKAEAEPLRPRRAAEIPSQKIEVSDDFFLSDLVANNQVKASPQSARILVVEDDEDQRAIIEMVLKEAGYEVFLAGNGREGFKVLEEKYPDLVISDLMMPEVDGAELIRKIKGDNRFSKLPILVLTVITDPEKEYLLLSLGVDDYCEKTVQRNILLKRIENLLRRTNRISASN